MAHFLSIAPDQWVPELAGSYVDEALTTESVAYRIGTKVSISATRLRIPTYQADPTSTWVAEGEDLSLTDATLSGFDVEPKTIAVLSKITRQFFDDNNDLSTAVLAGQGRDLARKIDNALFGSNSGNPKAPQGLEDVAGTHVIPVTGGQWEDLDVFAAAKFHAEALGEHVDWFIASPDDALELAVIKDQADSTRPLLGPDPSQVAATTILGVPLLVSDAITPGTVWAIPTRHLHIVQRNEVTAEIDHSVFFGSLGVALRSFARIGFGYSRPAAITRITTDLGS